MSRQYLHVGISWVTAGMHQAYRLVSIEQKLQHLSFIENRNVAKKNYPVIRQFGLVAWLPYITVNAPGSTPDSASVNSKVVSSIPDRAGEVTGARIACRRHCKQVFPLSVVPASDRSA